MRGKVDLLRWLLAIATLVLSSPLLVRRFDRNLGARGFGDDIPSAPAPEPRAPAFRRVTPERRPEDETEAQPPAAAGAADETTTWRGDDVESQTAADPTAEARAPLDVPEDPGLHDVPAAPVPPARPRSAAAPVPGHDASSPRVGDAEAGDWMEQLRRAIRQPETPVAPAATTAPVAPRTWERRLSIGRDAAVTIGLLAVAALVGLGMTAFVVGGAGETPSSQPAVGVSSTPAPSEAASATVPPARSPSPTAPPTASPVPATPAPSPTPTPALPIPTVVLASSHTDGVPHIEVSWEGVPDATAYELAFDRGDGEWQTVGLDPVTTTSTTIRIVPDRTYHFRVRAETDAGFGDWGVSDAVRLAIVDEDGDPIAYGGGWEPAFHDAYVGGDVRFSGFAGASAELSFDGVGVAWRGPRGPGRGRAEVFTDGESQGRVDAGAGTFSPQNILFATSFDEPGEHELRIVVEGTAGSATVAIDAFYVLEVAAE